jgi:hypothetical protein
MSEEYAGRQIVGMDLRRHRSVLVRMTEDGRKLGTVRITNSPAALRAGLARAGDSPRVALEAAYGWYRAADALAAAGRRCTWRILGGLRQGRVVKAEAAVSSGSCSAGLVRPDPVRVESEGCRSYPADHAFFHPAAQLCCQAPVVGQAEPVGDLAGVP